jgi:hypothetical protein
MVLIGIDPLHKIFLLTHHSGNLGRSGSSISWQLPSLGALYIWVKELKPAQGREGRLIIGSGYPFRCLTKLGIRSRTEIMELVFTEGAMQQLQTLKLSFIVQDVTRQYGDMGLENLSSLEYVLESISATTR